MAKELSPIQVAQALVGNGNAPFGWPLLPRDESEPPAKPPPGSVMLAGTDPDVLAITASTLSAARRMAPKPKEEPEPEPPAPREPTDMELAKAEVATMTATLERLARRRGVNLDAPPRRDPEITELQRKANRREELKREIIEAQTKLDEQKKARRAAKILRRLGLG